MANRVNNQSVDFDNSPSRFELTRINLGAKGPVFILIFGIFTYLNSDSLQKIVLSGVEQLHLADDLYPWIAGIFLVLGIYLLVNYYREAPANAKRAAMARGGEDAVDRWKSDHGRVA